jgi:hypothetical protein
MRGCHMIADVLLGRNWLRLTGGPVAQPEREEPVCDFIEALRERIKAFHGSAVVKVCRNRGRSDRTKSTTVLLVSS